MARSLDDVWALRLLDRDVRREGAATDEFDGREGEIARYLSRSAGRFRSSLEILEQIGIEPPVLELGADPWLFTQLLLERGIDVVSAGQRGGVWREDEAAATRQRVELTWAGRSQSLEHHLFNAERDRWPFEDGRFGTVICMEVLEHLVFSPAHLLYEAGRVLAEGGLLLVTTPNALAATKLARLLRGRSVHGRYSGYGAHGRHNREFTPKEISTLLSGAGFQVELATANVEGYEAESATGGVMRAFAGRAWPARRDHIFAVARRAGPPQLAFPDSLYMSVDRDRLRDEGVLLPDE